MICLKSFTVSSRLESPSAILYNLHAIYYFLRPAVVGLYTFGPCLKQNKTHTQTIYKIGMIRISCRSSESVCVYGNLCAHVGICVCLWESVCTCGNLCAHVRICVRLWESVCAHESRQEGKSPVVTFVFSHSFFLITIN